MSMKRLFEGGLFWKTDECYSLVCKNGNKPLVSTLHKTLRKPEERTRQKVERGSFVNWYIFGILKKSV